MQPVSKTFNPPNKSLQVTTTSTNKNKETNLQTTNYQTTY